jgi:hypothetical protein
MHSDIMGDDDLLGDDLAGDEDIMGDEIADYLVGADDILGDDLLGDDLMGDTDIMGDDIGDYLVGADRARRGPQAAVARKKNARAALLKRAMIAKRLKNAKLVHHRRPTKNRIQSLGFNRSAVPANTTVEIVARPQVLFRGTRLLVGSSIAPFFVVDDIKVGRNSQFVGTGAQPAEAFRDTATGDNIALDTCRPGVDITLIVTNTDGTAKDFRASIFGDVVE